MVDRWGKKCLNSGIIIKVQPVWFAGRFALGEKEVELDFIPLASVTERMKFPSSKTVKHCIRVTGTYQQEHKGRKNSSSLRKASK